MGIGRTLGSERCVRSVPGWVGNLWVLHKSTLLSATYSVVDDHAVYLAASTSIVDSQIETFTGRSDQAASFTPTTTQLRLLCSSEHRLIVCSVGQLGFAYLSVNIKPIQSDEIILTTGALREAVRHVEMDFLCLCVSDKLGEQPVILRWPLGASPDAPLTDSSSILSKLKNRKIIILLLAHYNLHVVALMHCSGKVKSNGSSLT